MENTSSSNRSHILAGVSLLFVFGILHRMLQLWLLWPRLVVAIKTTPDIQVMQLLPKAIMIEHPWWGLWFLQQSPPLPNFIWAAVLVFTQSSFRLAIIFLLFQAMLSSATAVAMALLFIRVGVRWWLGVILASIFLLGSDLLLLEYNPFGSMYYEMMTMLLVTLGCHAAMSVARTQSVKASVGLGLCVAGLALTRASFSYFWPVALLWLLWSGGWKKGRVIAAFLLPIFLLHGGWALKNYFAHGYWSWSTSSWAGINMQQGERFRNGPQFNRWVAQQPAMCPSPWYERTAADPRYFEFIPSSWDIELPAEVIARDQYIAEKRGEPALYDSVAARLWSQCLATEFFHYWLANPEAALNGIWRSYQMFWFPIRQFQVARPFPLRIEMDVYPEGIHWLRALRDAWREWGEHYSIRQTPMLPLPLQSSDYAPATIIALPFFASFISACNLVILHSLPLLLLFARGVHHRLVWPKGFSFLLLIYCYLAGLSSLVEFAENMRFRIDVEPIVWVICCVVLRQWLRCFGAAMEARARAVEAAAGASLK